MPPEKHNANTAGRPLMPTLAANRRAKSPFTPRLATNAASSTTPLSQRSTAHSDAGGRLTPGSKTDLSTPVKAFIDHHVTPRSSSRKSRVGTSSATSTPNTTPSVTPSSLRRTLTEEEPRTNENVGTPVGQNSNRSVAGRPKSVIGNVEGFQTIRAARQPGTRGHVRAESDLGSRGNVANIFHASDAKKSDTGTVRKKAPTFFYANGELEEGLKSETVANPPSPPLSAVSTSSSKFFHADGRPEGAPNPPLATPPIASVPAPFPPASGTQKPPSLRAPSPTKDFHLSYRKGASQIIRPNPPQRPSAMAIFEEQGPLSRRSSVGSTGSRKDHTKHASISSIDSITSARRASLKSDVQPPHSSPLHIATAPHSPKISPIAPLTAESQPQSPAKPAQNTQQQLNELAANARRERKVLDLEISNSSLLAINRSLEREVRKQKAELRRFRRLSRAGRLSLATGRSSLASDSTFDDDGDGDERGLLGPSLLCPLEEDGELDLTDDEDEREGDSEDEASSVASSSLSPAALKARDARHRAKDEKRLRLDLSRHRELLVDSQRMNQSLKRCLGWTEELIREGKRALEYRIRVSDVRMGGRVLAREDEEGDGDAGKAGGGGGLLRAWSPPERNARMSEETDKDSGIEVENAGADDAGLGASDGFNG